MNEWMNKDGCLALVGYGECQGWIYMKQMTLKLGLEKKDSNLSNMERAENIIAICTFPTKS